MPEIHCGRRTGFPIIPRPLLGKSARPVNPSAATRRMAKRILVVEDTKNLREIICYMLKQHGYEVLESGDGEEGYQKAVRDKPDLLVLDAMLPNRTGFEICTDLKAAPDTRAIPILMLTAVAQGTGKSDAYWKEKSHADDFMSKPFKAKELLDRVLNLIGPPDPDASPPSA